MKGKYFFPNIVQDMMNVYPLWSRVRNDPQSTGAQLLTALGQSLEDLRFQLQREISNTWLHKFDCQGLGPLGQVDISSIDLTYDEKHPAYPVLLAPTVTGTQNSNIYSVVLADPNSLETLFYESVPTRLSVEETVSSGVHIALDEDVFTEVSGVYSLSSPFEDLDCELAFPNRLYVTITGGEVFYVENTHSQCEVTITGLNAQNIEVREKLKFLFNDTLKTTKTFSKVTEVDISNVSGASTHLTVASARFMAFPLLDEHELAYTVDRTYATQKWDIVNSGIYQGTLLQQQSYTVVDSDVFRGGYAQLDTKRETRLETPAVSSGVILSDIAFQPHRYFFYGTEPTSGKLYVYDLRDRAWPDLGVLEKKNVESAAKLVTSRDFVPPGGTFILEAVLERTEAEPAKCRVTHKYPDGSLYIVHDGQEVVFKESIWDDRQKQRAIDPMGTTVLPEHELTLTDKGEHIFTVELVYGDKTEEADQRIVTVDYLEAQEDYDLSALSVTASGIDFDVDGQLWAWDGGTTYKRLQCHNDRMVIDAIDKMAYFYEDYDEVTFV